MSGASTAGSRAGRQLRLGGLGWPVLGALGLLTVVPLPRRAHGPPCALTLGAFAGVGLVLGGALAGAEAGLARELAALPRSAVLLALLAGLGGGLHLDGLADTADGLAGGRTPQDRLRIMRDSRTGGIGVAAVALVLLVDVSALASTSGDRLQALVVAVTASRAAAAVALGVSRPGRQEGLGWAFSVRGRGAAAAVGTAIALAAAIPLAGPRGLAAVAVACTCGAAVAAVFARKVGGMTGDGCGAVVELALAGSLLCLGAGLAG